MAVELIERGNWAAYDAWVAANAGLGFGIMVVMEALVRANQKERFDQLLDYYILHDYDPNDIIKCISWYTVCYDRYGIFKSVLLKTGRIQPWRKNNDVARLMGTILWQGARSNIPIARLIKMLNIASQMGFRFCDCDYKINIDEIQPEAVRGCVRGIMQQETECEQSIYDDDMRVRCHTTT